MGANGLQAFLDAEKRINGEQSQPPRTGLQEFLQADAAAAESIPYVDPKVKAYAELLRGSTSGPIDRNLLLGITEGLVGVPKALASTSDYVLGTDYRSKLDIPELEQARQLLNKQDQSRFGDVAYGAGKMLGSLPAFGGAAKLAGGAVGLVAPTFAETSPYLMSAIEGAAGGAATGAPEGPAEAAKSAVTFGVAAPFGALGGTAARTAAGIAGEAAALTALPAIMEGRLPTAEEGGANAMFILAMRLARIKTPSRNSFADVLNVHPTKLPKELQGKAARELLIARARKIVGEDVLKKHDTKLRQQDIDEAFNRHINKIEWGPKGFRPTAPNFEQETMKRIFKTEMGEEAVPSPSVEPQQEQSSYPPTSEPILNERDANAYADNINKDIAQQAQAQRQQTVQPEPPSSPQQNQPQITSNDFLGAAGDIKERGAQERLRTDEEGRVFYLAKTKKGLLVKKYVQTKNVTTHGVQHRGARVGDVAWFDDVNAPRSGPVANVVTVEHATGEFEPQEGALTISYVSEVLPKDGVVLTKRRATPEEAEVINDFNAKFEKRFSENPNVQVEREEWYLQLTDEAQAKLQAIQERARLNRFAGGVEQPAPEPTPKPAPTKIRIQKAVPEEPDFIPQEGVVDTNTPEFKQKFGRSQVKDETGAPLVVNHGTVHKFDEFSLDALGKNTGAPSSFLGFFFSKGTKTAIGYTGRRKITPEFIQQTRAKIEELNKKDTFTDKEEKQLFILHRNLQIAERALREGKTDLHAGELKRSYLRIENPFVVDMEGKPVRKRSYYEIISDAKAAGHDGVIIKNTFDGGPMDDIYVVFHPDQIIPAWIENPISKRKIGAEPAPVSSAKPADRYTGMGWDELKAEAKKRELPIKGDRATLVKAIRAHDAEVESLARQEAEIGSKSPTERAAFYYDRMDAEAKKLERMRKNGYAESRMQPQRDLVDQLKRQYDAALAERRPATAAPRQEQVEPERQEQHHRSNQLSIRNIIFTIKNFSNYNEPSIPEGYVRLYRGENSSISTKDPSDVNSGRYWTPKRSEAEDYGDRIWYIDVPSSKAPSEAAIGPEFEQLKPNLLVPGYEDLGSTDKTKQNVFYAIEGNDIKKAIDLLELDTQQPERPPQPVEPPANTDTNAVPPASTETPIGEPPHAEGTGSEAETGRQAEGAAGQEGGGLRVRDDAQGGLATGAGEAVTPAAGKNKGLRAKAEPSAAQPVDQPITRTAELSQTPESQQFEAVTPQEDVSVRGRYRVVSADDLVTSDNPAFEQRLQPRDRDSVKSREQISKIANAPDFNRLSESPTTDNGAPLINENGHVISGNGRVMGLRWAYDGNTASGYEAAVRRRASELNIDTAGIKKPILVREIMDTSGVGLERVAELSNRSQILGRSEAETAESDAKAIQRSGIMSLFNPDNSGDVRAAGNREFMMAFVRETGANDLLTKEGGFAPSAQGRVQRAILASVLSKNETARREIIDAIENAEGLGIQRVLNGIMTSGGRLLRLSENKPDYDISPDIGQALREWMRFKKELGAGRVRSLEEFLGQQDLFESNRSPITEMLLNEFDRAGSARPIRDLINTYSDAAEKIDTSTGSLFGEEVPQTTKEELLGIARHGEEPVQEGLFETAQGVSGKPPGQKSEVARSGDIEAAEKGGAEVASTEPPNTSPESGYLNLTTLDAELKSLEAQRAKVKPGSAEHKRIERAIEKNYEKQNKIIEAEADGEPPDTSPESGYINLNVASGQIKKGINAVGKWMKGLFTHAGHMPEEGFDANRARVNKASMYGKKLVWIHRDFNEAFKKVYGTKRISPAAKAQINTYLHGRSSLSTLPEPLRTPAKNLRNLIDSMSEYYVSIGGVEGNLAATFDENLGVYVHRAYMVHRNPNWKPSEPVRAKARRWLQSQEGFENATPDELDGYLGHLLNKFKAGESLEKVPLGAKNLGILKHRKDVPAPLREYWGEITDPVLAGQITVDKLGRLIANHEFLQEIQRVGMGKWLFDKSVGKFDTTLIPKGSESMYPLGGRGTEIFTTPEIAAEFKRVFDPKQWDSAVARGYLIALGAAKYSKIVLSPMSATRDFTSNAIMHLNSGDFEFWKNANDINKLMAVDVFGKLETDARRNLIEEMAEHGIVDTHLTVQDIREGEREVFGQLGGAAFETENVALKAYKKIGDLRQWSDNWWKVKRYLYEKETYRKLFPNWTDSQVMDRAAKIVRDNTPNYYMLPRFVKAFRRSPLNAPFVSYPAETIRILKNNIKLIHEEYQNPVTRGLAIKRMAGTALSLSIMAGLAKGSTYMLGIGRKEDKDVHRFTPPYMQNGNYIYISKDKDGKYTLVDTSYSDPWYYMKGPIVAAMNGDDPRESFYKAGAAVMNPFTNPELLTGALADIWYNKNSQTGAEIYNSSAPPARQALDMGKRLWDAYQPGVVTNIERIVKSHTGKTSVGGKSYNPYAEWSASVTGQRAIEIDVKQSFDFKVGNFEEEMRKSANLYTGVIKRRGTVSDKELLKGKTDMEQSRRRAFDQFRKDIEAMQRIGISDADIKSILKANNVSADMISQLMKNNYKEYKLSDEMKDRVRKIDKARLSVGGKPPKPVKPITDDDYYALYRNEGAP